MPHPERAIFSYQLNDWHFIKEKNHRLNNECPYGFGYYIFKNAYDWFAL